MNRSRASLWVTMVQAGLLGLVAGLAGYLLISYVVLARAQGRETGPSGGQFQGGPPPFPAGGFPGGRERKIVARFDKNGDKRLDADERKAARAALAEEPGTRGFGGPSGRRGGFGPGPGGFTREPATPGPKLSPADVRNYPNASLYDQTILRTVFLEFENIDWEQELAAFYNTDVEVPATATVDGKTYKNVGVHFRGMSSFMMVPEGRKRSLNLSFDFVDDKQNLGGYRTLNLLNANGDPTFVRPILYTDIAREYLPAPRMNYMQVVINGESWGVYINAQQFNKDYTRDYFQSAKGARWKVPGSPGGRGGMEYFGDDPAEYKRIYEIKTKDDPKSWADLIAMFRVLNETPADKLEAALRPILDVDGALKFLALEVALVNSDGYWARASDYSIYEDEKGQFHVIPHDVNEGLAEEGGGRGFGPRGGFRGPEGRGFPPDPRFVPGPPPGGGPGGPGGRRGRGMMMGGGVDLDPLIGLDDPSKPLRSKLLAVPALRERYLSYVREIAEKWLDWRTLEPRVRQYQALIADAVKADTRKLYSSEAFTTDVASSDQSVKSFVDRRRAFLLETR
jgi:hypothetical protein